MVIHGKNEPVLVALRVARRLQQEKVISHRQVGAEWPPRRLCCEEEGCLEKPDPENVFCAAPQVAAPDEAKPPLTPADYLYVAVAASGFSPEAAVHWEGAV
jgi:hypothetical protein